MKQTPNLRRRGPWVTEGVGDTRVVCAKPPFVHPRAALAFALSRNMPCC